MTKDWANVKTIQPHPIAKNKHLQAIFITEDNVDQIANETDAFSLINPHTILTGIMSMQRLPLWMIALNPKSQSKKYIFESDHAFTKYFQLAN